MLLPLTVAVNVWLCDGNKDTEDGVSETVTGGASVTVAVANFVGSATLVTFTVTVWELVIEGGAVYRPAAVMLPVSGLSDQVTAVLPVLVTEAEKLWVCDWVNVTLAGLTDTATVGGSFTVRLSCFESLPPALVALTPNVETPATVGVPLMMPVEDPRLSPAGSVPPVTAHVIGVVPVATNACE